MSNSLRTGLLQWDRFTGIWLALVGLLVAAALVTAVVGGAQGTNHMIPAYSDGVTMEDFVYNAYVAHLRGDRVRLQSMYAADTWAAMSEEDKDWGHTGFLAPSNLLGMRILYTGEGPDGLQARILYFYALRDGPLAIQRVEVSIRHLSLAPAGDSWKLQEILPRYPLYGY